MTDTEKALRFAESLRQLLPEKTDDINGIIKVLQERIDTENPMPLASSELRQRIGKPVWVVVKEAGPWVPAGSWWDIYLGTPTINKNSAKFRSGILRRYDEYGDTWVAYDHRAVIDCD